MLWTDAPDINRVQEVFMEIGKIKARIKLLEYDIEQGAIPIKKEHSRSPHLVKEAMSDQYKLLAELEAQLSELEAEKDFMNYHKELFRQYGYNNR
jgi:hypothetical protein